ncbi:signal peptidase I [Streptomyces montanus]|uniref:Signal peptidase I n=1 Tax=Streptomyces montanus TaxID=2580423 RepID=A0A5R9F7K7_9ACTN|nr:signal peptidase I [Streptomyces montanus]TLS39607.1 signal peptidase I [Streptomyces montanus]
MGKRRRLAVTAWVLGPLGLLILAGSLLYVRSAYTGVTVVSDGMSPTYSIGDRLVVERMSGAEVRRGDVVLFSVPERNIEGAVLQRVIAVGGDRVVCCEGSGAGDGTGERITVNGQPLDEPYVKDGLADGIHRPYDVKVPSGRLFLLGDHRVNSNDSRFYPSDGHQGTVANAAVLGRVADGFGVLGVWFGAGLLGLVLALIGLGFGIAALVVRKRSVPPLPPWPVHA